MTTIGLGLAIVSTGLWSGLLLTLTTILHPVYAAQDDRGFATELGLFLPVARRSPTNYLLVTGMLVGPVLAIIGLPTGVPLVLTVVGLVLVVAGPLLVSRFAAEPNYDVILGWDPAAVPAGWLATRRRYFALNWVRGVCTWAAFGLFLAAAYIDLR